MAVPSSPAAKASESKKSNKVKKKNGVEENGKPGTQKVELECSSKQSKRTTNPGVRVVGGRIYDSQNGKTCHQCRQKTMDFTAKCKNMKQDKQCTIMFCHKCLVNRYGEKAEEMEALDNWNCPKCRGICNCSVCMKKRGHKPTGILVHTAKATGFNSVSELLHIKGPDACQEMVVQKKVASPKKSAVSTEGSTMVSAKKRGKENSFDGVCNANLNSQLAPSNPNESKPKKAKREAVKDNVEVAQENGIAKSPKKVNHVVVRRSPRKPEIPQDVTEKKDMKDSDACGVPAVIVTKETKMEQKVKRHKHKKEANFAADEVEIVLPPGTLLSNVSGIDLLPEDVGYALQFLEFCSTFGEVLDIQKGRPESVLRDIMCGRGRRKGKYSSAVQFLIQLVAFILKDTEEESPPSSPTNNKDSWIDSLKRCLSESELELEDIPENCFDKGCIGYELLGSSQKLKLLTFLCDESLSTIEMRNFIDDQNTKFAELSKEARESLNAAKEKEKLIKRKLQDEVAKAIIARNGTPLTISDHNLIVSQIKAEAERARAEMAEAMDSIPKKKQRSDAVRTEPVFVDDKGHAYWKLRCYSDSDLLLQDMGGPERTETSDKWSRFDIEETKVIEKHISSIRLKRHWQKKLATSAKVKSSNSDLDSSSNEDLPTIANSS